MEGGHGEVGGVVVGAHRVVEHQQARRQMGGIGVIGGGRAVVERQRRRPAGRIDGVERNRLAHAYDKLHGLAGIREHRLRGGDRLETFSGESIPIPNGALSALAKSTATLRWSVITAPPELTTLISRFGVCWPEETV